MSMMAIWMALALAQAPTQAELGCVLETATAEDLAAIHAGVRTGEIAQSTSDRLVSQAVLCAPRFGWNDLRVAAMTAAAVATVARQRIGTDLTGVGVDAEVVDRWFAGQDEAMRTSLQMDQAWGERIVLGLLSAGISQAALDQHAERVGNYVGMLIVLERVRLGLPIE